MTDKSVAIFGAGITGLVAARELIRSGYAVTVYEAEDHVGGLASTYSDGDGFIYDNGPRFIFSTLAEKLGIADICQPVKYYEHLFVGGRYYLFPFGFARNLRYLLSAGTATLTRNLHSRPANLGEFLRVYYGRRFSREVLAPLIEKWAGLPSEKMSVDFASRLLPTNLSYVIHSLIKRLRGGITEDYYRKGRYIVYPRGSNSKIFEALASTPGLGIRLGSRLERLETDGDRIQSAVVSGAGIRADLYLSTIPISSMAGLVDRSLPLAPWEKLKYRGVLILIVKLKRTRVLEGLWTWFPEPKYRFYRISEFKNALPELAPPDKTLLAVEIACNVDDPFWSLDAAQVFSAVAPDLRELYGLESSEVIGLDLKKSPHAYPVLAKATEATQRVLTHQTPFSNLFIAGRTGMFQYRMLEGCYESAVECVAEMVSAIHGEQPSLKSTVGVDRFGRPQVVPE